MEKDAKVNHFIQCGCVVLSVKYACRSRYGLDGTQEIVENFNKKGE